MSRVLWGVSALSALAITALFLWVYAARTSFSLDHYVLVGVIIFLVSFGWMVFANKTDDNIS